MVKQPPLEGLDLIRYRQDDLDRRMHAIEQGQALAWTWSASAQGAALERRLGTLIEAVELVSDETGSLDLDARDSRESLAAIEKRLGVTEAFCLDLACDFAGLLSVVDQLVRLTGLPGMAQTEIETMGRLGLWAQRVLDAAEVTKD